MPEPYYLTARDVIPKSFNVVGASGNWRVWQTAKKTWEARIVQLIRESGMPVGQDVFAKTTAILTVPTRRRRDAGNFGVILEKALGDALQVAGVIPDDTPEYWSWTSVTFTHTPREKATTFVIELLELEVPPLHFSCPYCAPDEQCGVCRND